MNMRMKKNQIRIGTYYLQPNARSEDHVRDLAQCGIDFVIGVERDGKLLDLLEQYQVGAIVNRVVPGWFGGNGANAGTMAEKNPLEAYETAARSFQDHPAIWGIDIGDEPSCLDFPHYGRRNCPRRPHGSANFAGGLRYILIDLYHLSAGIDRRSGIAAFSFEETAPAGP